MIRLGRSRGGGASLLATACAVLAALVVPTAASAAGPAHASIVGGRASSIAEFPFLTYIEAHKGRHGFACTGSVISPRVILTAAHCVEEIEKGTLTPAVEYAVATGVSSPQQAGPANVFRIVETHVFPGFEPGGLHGDAALLVLDRPTTATPIPLAGAGDAALYQGGAPIQLAGWGLTRAGATNPPANLRSATTVLQKPGTCKSKTRTFYRSYSPAEQLCTLDLPSKKSSGCFGDSGGPGVTQRIDGTLVEVGVISSGAPLCDPTLPNVLTRVDLVSTWASQWIAAIETGAPPPAGAERLPKLEKEGAEELAVFTLLNAFGKRFENASQVFGNCKQASKVRFRCQIAWIYKRDFFAGEVSPFYVLRQQAVAWDSHYRVEWAPLKCLQQSKNINSCHIHSRNG
jgi:secreted trypsin-like serine protease